MKTESGYHVTKRVRDTCVFARQDLTRDPPFSHLDLVCCRNVLIYMDSTLQRKLLSMFHYALKPDGVLVLGHAESIGYHSDLFAPMNKKNKVYRKKAVTANAPAMDIFRPPFRPATAAAPAVRGPNETTLVLNDATRIIMERYAPPSVLLDQQFHVVQFNGQTGLYLEPSRQAGLHLRQGGTSEHVDIEVIPVQRQGHSYYLVLFHTHETPGTAKSRTPAVRQKKTPVRGRVSKLEEELAATREYLQSTIQEIEAANEELQSTNEELDTAKEELQSTNEELNTVNTNCTRATKSW
ncbi:MAG TPA: CheR family methyltransferase [Vicinamibacterales bacterium]|nr:CheR family methyltransferase [Vicinamibacterales bacterium]